MGVSSLVSLKRTSPNRTSPRNHKIDTITIHCYVGQASIEDMAAWLCNPSAKASANYGIGSDGRIISFMDDNDRSWCSSSSSNDNRAITIECASDKTHPYAINNKVYGSLINLCADICKRHEIKKLKWKNDKSLIGQPDKQNLTVHRWFATYKECPGEYIFSRLGQIAEEVNAKLGVIDKPSKGLQASSLKNLSEKEVVERVGSLFTEDQKKSGILASVSCAQFILESGYGKTDLAQNANNCFGMKKELSGNNWPGSTWDGKSKYTKITKECYDGVNYVDVKADFRKYPSIAESIGDHSAYLLGAMNGSKKRYEGLKNCTDYRKAITIIKNGGYATDPKYIDKICDIIKRWNLTKYDTESGGASNSTSQVKKWYRVRKTWPNEASQKGAFEDYNLAKKSADKHPGYSVYDENGKILYTSKKEGSTVPFKIKVNISDLNIRTGPGTGYAATGHYTGVGTFTITEVKSGKGSIKGWGKLKSGAGWISLDYATKI